MKKILLVLTIASVFMLGACSNAPDKVQELENRIAILEAQMLEVEDILVNIEVIEGLNGQKEYYIPDNSNTASNFVGVSAQSILLGDELDKSKSPSYVLDENDEYVNFDKVVELLIEKYFGDKVTIVNSKIGFQIKIVLEPNEISQSEYMARLILMIEELSNYDFYIIGGSELYIQTNFGGTSWVIIPIQTLRSSFITITPAVVYNGLYEIDIYNHYYNPTTVQTLYDEYVLSGLYVGYALNYE